MQLRFLVGLLVASLPAQALVYPGPPRTGVLPAARIAGESLPDQPGAERGRAPDHVRYLIPPATGPGLPQPDSREMRLPGGESGPGDFNIWYSRSTILPGNIASWPPEPQAIVEHDAVLFTHNNHAAMSSDSGVTWSLVTPQNLFPNSDGGFNGDQRLVRSHAAPNLTIWVMQYAYSAATQGGRHRLAIARGRDDIKNGSYYYYDFAPTDFGFAQGLWFDFPDLACSNEFLYGSANIYQGNGGGFAGAVLWRISLAELATGGTVNYTWYTNATLGVNLYRLTQNATDTMWASARWNANTLRLYKWPDHGAFGFANRTTANTSTAAVSAPGPDGRDWTGSCDHRVLGGFVAGNEVGFLYSSAPVPNRPRGHVRVTVFDAGTSALAYEEDIWSSQATILYPAASRNAFNHKAVVMALGGGGFFPSTVVTLNDPDSPGFGGGALDYLSQGNSGPAINRWGDYIGVTFHPLHPATFVAPAHSQQGGPTLANSQSRFVWFGRERYTPAWVDVDIRATDRGQALSVPIQLTQTDRFLQKDGTTPFRRSYPPRQALTAYARPGIGIGGVSYQFIEWTVGGVRQPPGQNTLDLSDIGLLATVAEARYEPAWKLDVDSLPPGVTVAVNTRDLLGRLDGTTPFERYYPNGTRVTLVAPANVGNRFLTRWFLDNQPQTASQQTLSVLLDRDVRALADYGGVTGNGVQWTHLTNRSPTRPGARRDHAMTFDRNTGQVVLFGGDSNGNIVGDTWELSGDQWTQRSPQHSPAYRYGAAAAYDPYRGNTVLFGGAQYFGVLFADTWVWDGVDWSQIAAPQSPSPRLRHALAFDWLNGRTLLFGGIDSSTVFSDTWSFDGATWTQLTPTRSPPPLLWPSMIYQQRYGTMLLTGLDPTTTAFQVWEFDGVDWVSLPVNSTLPGRGTPIAYDPHRDRLVFFAGMLSAVAVAPGETHEWDQDSTYAFERSSPVTPAGRGRHGFVFDEWRNRFVLFGGQTATGFLGDTWEYTYECDAVAEGHAGGGLEITCTSPPRLGGTLCLEFPSPTGTGALLVGIGGLLMPPLTLGPPVLCSSGFITVSPDVVLTAPGSPARVCVAVPNVPALAHGVLGMQGLSPTATGCAYLTRGAVVVIRP